MTGLREIFREQLAVDLDGNALLVAFGRDFGVSSGRHNQRGDDSKNSNRFMIHRLNIKHDGTTDTTKFRRRARRAVVVYS